MTESLVDGAAMPLPIRATAVVASAVVTGCAPAFDRILNEVDASTPPFFVMPCRRHFAASDGDRCLDPEDGL